MKEFDCNWGRLKSFALTVPVVAVFILWRRHQFGLAEIGVLVGILLYTAWSALGPMCRITVREDSLTILPVIALLGRDDIPFENILSYAPIGFEKIGGRGMFGGVIQLRNGKSKMIFASGMKDFEAFNHLMKLRFPLPITK
jgi:hypothetical protein